MPPSPIRGGVVTEITEGVVEVGRGEGMHFRAQGLQQSVRLLVALVDAEVHHTHAALAEAGNEAPAAEVARVVGFEVLMIVFLWGGYWAREGPRQFG